MAINESDETEIDYEFISKYIRDDSGTEKTPDDKPSNFSSIKFDSVKQGPTEVLGSIGQEDINSPQMNFHDRPFYKRPQDESIGLDNSDEDNEKIESGPVSKIATEAKKEFIEHLEDESLTIDTCERLTHDWKK
jgi:hypothetical protein